MQTDNMEWVDDFDYVILADTWKRPQYGYKAIIYNYKDFPPTVLGPEPTWEQAKDLALAWIGDTPLFGIAVEIVRIEMRYTY